MRKYSEQLLREWSANHFPDIDTASDDAILERHLRHILVEGSTFFDRYPLSTNRTLHTLKPYNKYRRYFTNKAKVEFLGHEKFHFLCQNGGSKYTNEYQFVTLLSDFVSDAVVGKSVKLLKQYGLQVF